MGTISIKGMEFYAYHGCFSEEQIIGNHFSIDLEMKVNVENAEQTDNLTETVNYQAVYALVKIEMEKKSKLLEHVAHRIVTSVMLAFSEIQEISITVSKLNPPLGGKVDRVCYSFSVLK